LIERLPSELKLTVGLARWLRIDFKKKNKIGDDKMDKLAAKIYLTGKILELGKTLIYKTEIVAKGKAGAEKFKQVYEGFWDKLEDLLEKEKSIDRKWIPDFAEEIGEEVLSEVLKEARKTFDLKVILQQIFDEEKLGNKNIL
jgi:universal stress protein